MADTLTVTLISNAGLLLQYGGFTMLLDGIYGREGHPFSNLRPGTWEAMLAGRPPFQQMDYLLFSHAHPDHFSPEMVRAFLLRRKVKGVFLPDCPAVTGSGLLETLEELSIPCVLLSSQTDHAVYQIESRISLRAFSTLHLDKKYSSVAHFCYLISFGGKQVLFTADVDYLHETFSQLRATSLRAAFVNPLFFSALRTGRFFKGTLNAKSICIYHVPFSGDDPLRMRPSLAHDMVVWPPGKPETLVLCDEFQTLQL